MKFPSDNVVVAGVRVSGTVVAVGSGAEAELDAIVVVVFTIRTNEVTFGYVGFDFGDFRRLLTNCFCRDQHDGGSTYVIYKFQSTPNSKIFGNIAFH